MERTKAAALSVAGEGEGAVRRKRRNEIINQIPLHIIMLPATALVLVFSIAPLFGIIMAFQIYEPAAGIFHSQFVDIYQFRVLFAMPNFLNVLFNTVYIAVWKIVLITVLSIVFALLLNELVTHVFKKTVQTIIFLPYFLSWALIGSVFVEMFSSTGTFSYLMQLFRGGDRVSFITSNRYFRGIVVLTDVWKTLGYQVVVFLAAITTVDPTLYEAADVDGANRWHMCRYITVPGIMSIIVLMSVLNIGNIMNAGFEQILVMYSPIVYPTGDILDTMSYRQGLLGNQYSQGTAISLFKSIISCIFFAISYRLAYKINGYRVF